MSEFAAVGITGIFRYLILLGGHPAGDRSGWRDDYKQSATFARGFCFAATAGSRYVDEYSRRSRLDRGPVIAGGDLGSEGARIGHTCMARARDFRGGRRFGIRQRSSVVTSNRASTQRASVS
jgi:hypothetical protein